MIAVSDTSPLNYLVLIESAHILPSLFEHVAVPRSVALELAHENAPSAVHSWIETPPHWLRILTPSALDPTIVLGSGERDAICLANELEAEILLMDDRAARRVAKDRGLSVVGTLGLLESAGARGLIDLPDVLEVLLRTNFRIRADVVRSILDR